MVLFFLCEFEPGCRLKWIRSVSGFCLWNFNPASALQSRMVPRDLTKASREERSDLQMTRGNGSKTDLHRRNSRLCAQSIYDV